MKTKMMLICSIMLMLVSTSILAQVTNNIPTFVNEENCVVMKFTYNHELLDNQGWLKSPTLGDTIKPGNMYLKMQGKQLIILITPSLKEGVEVLLAADNFYLQNNILLLEGEFFEIGTGILFKLIVKLSDKDKLTFQEFTKAPTNNTVVK